jgi:SNF2 family DNA or RNA helicase
MTFSLLIVDESQWVKNPDTQAARALADVRCDSRIALTGTPLENHLGELWAQFNITMPGYLGERRRFNRHFRTPIEKHADVYKAAVLQQRIAPFMLRRTKDRVATELPLKTETTLFVEMEAPQRALYDALRAAQHSIVREAIAAQGIERSGIIVLSALLKLRQVCCDPRLIKTSAVGDPMESAKLEALVERAESLIAEGRVLLIFSQFTQMLDLIAQRIQQCRLPYAMLTGQTLDRGEVVKRFQNGEVPILLASLKAGGVGLNLTAADTVIHYDPWWNPAAENQATDRAHRMGQDKPVFVYRLVCRNTIEERIESLKLRKSALIRGVLNEPVEQLGAFDGEHVEYLLGGD